MNPTSDVKFEIGHVLFIDIVGYSKLLINEQSDQIQKLKEIVRGTERVRVAEAEGKVLRLPTGDGGALVFRTSPEAPVRCALEISKELKKHPEIRVRMGIHSGPVNEVVDLNEQANIAGAGINIAQRVMDCGDAGHILLSRRVAEDLEHYREWQPLLHDLGEVEVKHGARVHVFNLHTEDLGNPELPEKFRLAKTETGSSASDASPRREEGFWVAVLPFKYVGANADLSALAEGLSEDIVTGLSRFSYLKVVARSSSLRLAKDSGDVRAVGKEIGARYVMEGSLRQAGAKLRLAVQLVDAVSGAHLWAENYERDFSPETIFELQDDLVPRIVSTVADMNGVLPRSLSEAVRSRTPDQLSPYEAVLRGFGYLERVTPEDLAVARSGLEAAVRKTPAYADAWAMLAYLCVQDYAQGFNLQVDCLTSGLSAARRAVEIAPSNHLAYLSLAQALFFEKEFQGFRNAAERAITLNPMDGNSIAFLGELLVYAGESERGLTLATRAKQLNPNHPGWYWYADFYHSFRQSDYRGALSAALKINHPGQWAAHAMVAAAYGQLGESDAAGKALRDLLKLRPDFATTVRKDIEKWWEPEPMERLIDGWRKAGLEISEEDQTLPARAGKSSSTTRAEQTFWVAVLPFKSSGGVEIESFADGLSEDITTGLSRFPYLSVVARAAAARLKGRAGDERTLGAELGARYVVEGSIRKQGSAIRVSARLIDTETGAQLWAENYDRDLEVSSIFAVQDDVAARIVATVADSYGVLVNSMTAQSNAKDDADLTPAEWQCQYFAYRQQITPASHAALKKRLEAVLERNQRRAEIWSCLAQMYVDAYAFGFQADPTDLDRALVAARRGVEFDRTNQFGLVSLAQVYFFRQDLAAFRPAAERAMALNPLNTDALGILGLLIVHTGEFDRGGAIVRRAMELNPDHAGWMHFGPIWEHFHKGEYERALDHANQVDIPGLFWPYLVVASTCGHLGRKAQAEAAVRDLLTIDPEFVAHAHSNVGTWHFASGLMDPILEGLRKAGLAIPASGAK
jgi:TolB-like protein/class 3 adenylate cyclase/Tfp pilus assembly protein PilF